MCVFIKIKTLSGVIPESVAYAWLSQSTLFDSRLMLYTLPQFTCNCKVFFNKSHKENGEIFSRTAAGDIYQKVYILINVGRGERNETLARPRTSVGPGAIGALILNDASSSSVRVHDSVPHSCTHKAGRSAEPEGGQIYNSKKRRT